MKPRFCGYRRFSAGYYIKLGHIGEALDRLGEFLYGLVGVAVLNALDDAVAYVPLEDDLPAFMQGGLGGIYLGEHILAGDILVDHLVNGLHLADYLFESPMKVRQIHALLHTKAPFLFPINDNNEDF